MQHAIVVFRIKWVWIWLRLSGTRVPSRGAFFGRIEDPSFQKKKKKVCGVQEAKESLELWRTPTSLPHLLSPVHNLQGGTEHLFMT